MTLEPTAALMVVAPEPDPELVIVPMLFIEPVAKVIVPVVAPALMTKLLVPVTPPLKVVEIAVPVLPIVKVPLVPKDNAIGLLKVKPVVATCKVALLEPLAAPKVTVLELEPKAEAEVEATKVPAEMVVPPV